MQQQTYIVYLFKTYADEERRNYCTFERFNSKRLETVIKNMQKLLDNDLYRSCIKEIKSVLIYRTPDGIHPEPAPAAALNVKDYKLRKF